AVSAAAVRARGRLGSGGRVRGPPPQQAGEAPRAVAPFSWPGADGSLLASNGGLRQTGRTPERQHLGLAGAAPAGHSRWGGGTCWSRLVTSVGDGVEGGRSGWHGCVSFECRGHARSITPGARSRSNPCIAR